MSGNARDAGGTVASKIVAILRAFAGSDQPLRLADVSRASNLPAATTLRLVRELVIGGLLIRGDDSTYRASTLLWQIGTLTANRGDIRDAALPYMEDLYVSTGQNVQLAVLSGNQALVIEKIHGRGSVEMASLVAAELPLHATGVGKALLAHADPSIFDRIVEAGLHRYTKNTNVDPVRLARVLQGIRDTGVAYNFEERELGLMSVAVPIRTSNGRMGAAISVSMRASSADIRRLTPAVITAGRGISRAISSPDRGSGVHL